MENNKKPDAENLLQVCDIYKSFGDNAVLKGMTLSLASGEVLSLIGGNGAGKSTLMKIIMGIYTHDSGKVIVNGKEMTLSINSQTKYHVGYNAREDRFYWENGRKKLCITPKSNQNDVEISGLYAEKWES